MTKQKELELLEKIDALIKSAGADSYIGETFAGVVGICRNNIEDDFANHPVHDLEMMRTRCDSEIRMHEQTKKDFSEYRASTEKVIYDLDEELIEWKNKYSDAIEHYTNLLAEKDKQMSEMRRDIAGSDECNKELRNEIIRLKAEIYDWERA